MPLPDLSIRDATKADMPRLREITDLSFPYFRLFALHSVSDLSQPVLVCEVDGAVAGFAKLVEFNVGNTRCGCILWIATHPTCRRRGIASALAKAGAERLVERGSQLVFASTQRRNVGAQTTLTGAGFCRVGFFELRRLFGWRVFSFYNDIWYAPGEIIFLHKVSCPF
jgi:ribosomal protein S18 acetylase RimI-like enzyme